MKLRAEFLLLLALFAMGCDPPASVVGPIQGKTFAPVEAISDLSKLSLGRTAVIVASTEQGSCDLFSKNQIRKNSQFLVISLANVDFGEKQLVPPTGQNKFPVLDPKSQTISTDTLSLVSFQTSDGSCMSQATPVDAVEGEVKLDAADDLAFSGSGDVTLNTGDHITFTFNSTPCYSLGSALVNEMMATCL